MSTEETKKGIEKDVSILAVDCNQESVWDYKEWKEIVTDQGGYGKTPVLESKYALTLAEFLARTLERAMADDKDEFAEKKKRVMLARKLRKYGDKPLSLKMENWTFIRERLLRAKPPVPATIVVQFDEIINGEITDKDLEDL